MTANRRIILNILASYGRTLISIGCGIFSTRWVLMALGQESFGLYGLVASLTGFVSFFNAQFSGALSRYYAYSIGQAQVAQNQNAIANCQSWFTTGVVIHVIIPLVLICIGYPIGAYAITHGWLTIPSERMEVCLWLWRFVSITCFVSMVNVPFNAMYVAKQYIAELTCYSVIQTVLRTSFIYYMTTVERDWLFGYGLGICIILIIPQVLICIRAMIVFDECRFRLQTIFDFSRVKKLAIYAWWQTFGGLGFLCRHQCLEIIANKFFGPKINAAYSIGAQVGSESAILTGALNAAFAPAIATAYGAEDMRRFRMLAYRACKFGVVLTLIFTIPLCMEIDEVLLLWLKNPPASTSGFCLIWLIVMVLEKFYSGHIIAVNASGRIARFQFFHALTCFMGLPFGVILSYIFNNPYMVGVALIISTILSGSSDIILARKRAGLSVRYLISHIVIPIAIATVCGSVAGGIPRYLFSQSFWRVCLTTICTEIPFLSAVWFIVLSQEERAFISVRLKSRVSQWLFLVRDRMNSNEMKGLK